MKNKDLPQETRGRKAKYNFADMKINGAPIEANVSSAGLLSTAKGWAKRNGSKYIFKVNKTETGAKLWRIK